MNNHFLPFPTQGENLFDKLLIQVGSRYSCFKYASVNNRRVCIELHMIVNKARSTYIVSAYLFRKTA